jgi:hypothetical protein
VGGSCSDFAASFGVTVDLSVLDCGFTLDIVGGCRMLTVVNRDPPESTQSSVSEQRPHPQIYAIFGLCECPIFPKKLLYI